MRNGPQHNDLVEMSFTWQDIETAVAKRDPTLAAALAQSYRVEAVVGANSFGDPHNVFDIYFDPAGDRQAIRTVRDGEDVLHRIIKDHLQLYDHRYSHSVRVLPPADLHREAADDGGVECERMNLNRPNAIATGLPMKGVDRLDAIQRVARALSGRSWIDIDLALDSVGLPTEDGSWSDPYGYVVEMLRSGKGRDAALHELDQHLRGEGAPFDATEADQIWRPGSFRLFISHTSGHKVRAAALADTLERLSVHGFVAHDAIEPTREWQDVIETALLSCDAVCALMTADFIRSPWCDQEVGFAVAQRKLVLPLRMGADPHGFMARYQAISSAIDPDTVYRDIEAMLLALVRHPTTSSKAAPVAVHRYARSGSLAAARAGFRLLQAIAPHDWTPGMIEEVDRANVENSQLEDGVLSTGASIREAVQELLQPLRPPPVVQPPHDDDIPF